MGDVQGTLRQGGEEEDTEGSLTDETDEGPDGWESPTDSGDSRATSRVSTSEEEWEADRWVVGSESSHKEELLKSPWKRRTLNW